MGHHIDPETNEFRSDRHPDLDPDKVVVSFGHTEAHPALWALSDGYRERDPEFAGDVAHRLSVLGSTRSATVITVDGEWMDRSRNLI